MFQRPRRQHLLERGKRGIGLVDGVADIEPEIGRDLVVARAPGVQAPGRRPDQFRQPALSLGSVAGALVGAGFAALGPPLVVHLAITSAVGLVCAEVASHWFLAADPHHDAAPGRRPRAALRAWPERRTLLIGLVHACAALIEGIANDWSDSAWSAATTSARGSARSASGCS